MTEHQKGIIKNAAIASALALIVIALFNLFFNLNSLEYIVWQNRFIFTLKCDIFVMLWVIVGIGAIANKRFLNEKYITGNRGEPGSGMEIRARILQNTLEQAFLTIFAHFALSVFISPTKMIIIPALVFIFCLGRTFFWIGYTKFPNDPPKRALGFGLTAYPTFAVYLYLLAKIIF